MKKKLVSFLLACFLVLAALPLSAQASNFYLIEDSDTRLLTKEELYTWQYDALGYILNEIFARHGYHFIPGGKYDNYFRCQTWYSESTQYDTNQELYKTLSQVEWNNESLIKDVRKEMLDSGNANPAGKALPKVSALSDVPGVFSSFTKGAFAANQVMKVYTGPGENYYRPSKNGQSPAVSTNDTVWVGGWENGWLMVLYETNKGNVRVGYVAGDSFTDRITAPRLAFTGSDAVITTRCALTDDPVVSYTTEATLEAGTKVTYLSTYVNASSWAYVETTVDGKPCRGFLDISCLSITEMEQDK